MGPPDNTDLGSRSHEDGDLDSSVIHVRICGEGFAIGGAVVCTVGGDEWVADHAVTSLETNFWLEVVRIDRANHLEGNIWAVE